MGVKYNQEMKPTKYDIKHQVDIVVFIHIFHYFIATF